MRSFPGNIYLQIEERFAEKIFIRYKLEEKAKRGISECPNLENLKAVKEGGDLEMHLVELAFTAGQAINLSFLKKTKSFKFSSQTIASKSQRYSEKKGPFVKMFET